MKPNAQTIVLIVAAVCLAISGPLAVHNIGVHQAMAANGDSATVAQWGATAGTSLAAIASALTVAIAFIVKVWKPTTDQGVSTLELLKAVAVILQQMPVFKQMQDAYAAHGLPTFVRLEVGWNGQPPLQAGWDLNPTPAPTPSPEVKP